MTSIIIPAHQEESVISRCLERILRDARPGEFEIVVACNGCTDRTAEIAASFAGVEVVETPEAGKPGALNLGDEAATRFPRLYVDADIEVTTSAVRRTAHALAEPGVLAAAPRLQVDLAHTSRGVTAFYRIWTRAGWVGDELVGSGVYGVSEAGRGRFVAFPPIIADDLYFRCLFTGSERRVVPDASFVVRPPRTLRALVRTRTRIFAGNYEFRRAFPTMEAPRSDATGVAAIVRGQPRLLPSALVYVGVQVAAKAMGWWRFRTGTATWNRDLTARADSGA